MAHTPKTIVSLGMSCQTTHQIARFAIENPERATHIKGPFDWLICPANALVSWLEDDLQDFREQEITVERDHAYWPRHGLWLWHWFYTHKDDDRILDIDRNFSREISKLENVRERFSNCDPANTVFFFSNSQNNLSDEVFLKSETSLYHLTPPIMTTLETRLSDFFDEAVNVQWISRTDRLDPICADGKNVHLLPNEPSQWKGCNADWDEILHSIL